MPCTHSQLLTHVLYGNTVQNSTNILWSSTCLQNHNSHLSDHLINSRNLLLNQIKKEWWRRNWIFRLYASDAAAFQAALMEKNPFIIKHSSSAATWCPTQLVFYPRCCWILDSDFVHADLKMRPPKKNIFLEAPTTIKRWQVRRPEDPTPMCCQCCPQYVDEKLCQSPSCQLTKVTVELSQVISTASL